MRIAIFLFLSLLKLGSMVGWAQGASTQIITLKNEFELLSVGKQIYFLEDIGGQLTIHDILKPENQTKFSLSEQNIFTRTPTASDYWLRFTFQNLSGKEAWLELNKLNLAYIDFYAGQGNQYQLVVQTGINRPIAQKPYPSNVYWVPLGNTATAQIFYIKLSTRTVFEIPLHIGSIRALEQEKNQNDYLVGGFVGLMLIMLVYNLFLFLSIREWSFVPYLGYVLTSIFSATFLNNYGLIYEFVPEAYHYLVHEHVYVWLGLPIIFIGIFALIFLELAKKNRVFARVVYVHLGLVGIIIPFINILGLEPRYWQSVAYQITTLTFTVSLLIISSYLWFGKKDKNARFYVLAWVWAIMGILSYLLCINGVLPYNLFTRNSIYFGIGLETWMFSLALADRINRLREEKLGLQIQNIQLIQEQNKNLEQKITQRTVEINRSRSLLEETGKLARFGAWELEWKTGKITWSKVTREIHGVEPEFEPDIDNVKKFYPDGWAEKMHQAAYDCAKQQVPIDLEMLLLTAQGRSIWVRLLGQGEYENGRCIRLYGTFQDIDERKRAEIETERVKEKLASIFNSLNDMVWSVRLPNKKAILITPSAEAIFEIPLADLMADYKLWHTLVHPDDQAVIGLIEKSLETQPEYYYEYRIITQSGKLKWLAHSGKLIYNQNGLPFRVDGFISDITRRKQAEREIIEAKNQLTNILDSMSEVIWSLRLPERKMLFVTPSITELYGISQQKFMEDPDHWDRAFHPEDRVLIPIIFQELATKGAYYHEYRIVTPQGITKWVSDSAKLIYDEYQNPIRLDGLITDISLRKQAQSQLSNVFESMSEVVWSVSLPDYKMLMLTPSAVDLYGIAYEDFMNDSSYWEKAIHPEDKGIVLVIYESIATQGNYYQEYRIVSTQGEVKWISNNGKVIFDVNGIPIRLDGVITNITQRKQAEQTLAEERHLLRTIIDNIPINIYVKDLLSRKILANKAECEYMGVENEADILGKSDAEIYPQESAMPSLEEDALVMQKGETILGKETFNLRFDGRKSWFLTSKIPIHNLNGEITGLVGISYDFTQRKESEEQLRRTLKELQETQEALEQQAEEIQMLNNHLESLVVERTRLLSIRNQQLQDYAFFNSHKLRAPIATILGLYEVMDLGITSDENELIISKLRESILLLDKMVKKSQSLLDEVDDKDEIINPDDEEK
ncbi:MAG: PAS domain-containing protein [Microscillaceae bacterium]|jgi:PAS domain S-box-containing protein|nr:PAS domain-containing protein [Microscillaceae bacterium]